MRLDDVRMNCGDSGGSSAMIRRGGGGGNGTARRHMLCFGRGIFLFFVVFGELIVVKLGMFRCHSFSQVFGNWVWFSSEFDDLSIYIIRGRIDTLGGRGS